MIKIGVKNLVERGSMALKLMENKSIALLKKESLEVDKGSWQSDMNLSAESYRNRRKRSSEDRRSTEAGVQEYYFIK
jgi:hypothetical protein